MTRTETTNTQQRNETTQHKKLKHENKENKTNINAFTKERK